MGRRHPLELLPCLDSAELAAARQAELDLTREVARGLGESAVQFARQGYYLTETGTRIDWKQAVHLACTFKRSIDPQATLPPLPGPRFSQTRVQVTNETTMGASQRLIQQGHRPLALNFANGVEPGGGLFRGSRAQEETLCRSSALYLTLEGDPMYTSHQQRPRPDSSDWAILSPDVPFFRTDSGQALEEPWLLSILTCAAPYAPDLDPEESAQLLQRRIHRVLAIAGAYKYEVLVLGAWGCGAFRNDPLRTAQDFRQALENDFAGSFTEVCFAIADWSDNRRILGPFRDVFAPDPVH